MKNLFLFLFVTFIYLCTGCGEEIKFDDPKQKVNTQKQNTFSNNFENTDSTSTSTQNNSEYMNNDSSLVITTVETEQIPQSVTYDYYYPNSKITFYFNIHGMSITLFEKNNWYSDYDFIGEWAKKSDYPYTIYSNTLSGGEKLVITMKNNTITKINFSGQTYPINTKETTPNNTVRSSRLKYLDNHQIEVKKGQNLNYIISVYKQENGVYVNEDPKVTLDRIKRINKLTSNTIIEGQIINFSE